MPHNCAFNNDHSPLIEQEYISMVDKGYCPLCLHDFATPVGLPTNVCIECGHTFTIQVTPAPVHVNITPLE